MYREPPTIGSLWKPDRSIEPSSSRRVGSFQQETEVVALCGAEKHEAFGVYRSEVNMTRTGMLKKMRSARIVVVLLALLLAYGGFIYSPQAATPIQLYSVSLGGITGVANNTVLAFDRFLLVAPFWPSAGVADNGDLDLTKLDNKFIYVVDTKKPNGPVLSKELSNWDAKQGTTRTVYFPSRVVFDSASSNVYVRGTRFDESNGEVTPIDVIAYVHLSLDDNSKPVLDTNVIPIDIKGVSSDFTSSAPLDFALSSNGNLVFTNGASVFSYNLSQGYLYELPIVHPSTYGSDDNVSFLDIDQATNVVSICENRNSLDPDKNPITSSEISFYRLTDAGTFNFLKIVRADQLPASLSSGSNIAIVSDSDSQTAFFVTSDGSLSSVDLLSGGASAAVKQLYTFPELAQLDSNVQNPLSVQYDPSTKSLGIVKRGFTIQISRPLNGKRGHISRPLNIASHTSVLAMAKLSKKNKVASTNSFSQDFAGEGGISNFVTGPNSQWLISTYSGKLYSVGIAGDLQNSQLQYLGPIGSRIDRVEYYANRTSVVAISSFTFEVDGLQVASPGSLVIGRMGATQAQSASAVLQALLPTASVLGKRSPSIRRPCNIR